MTTHYGSNLAKTHDEQINIFRDLAGFKAVQAIHCGKACWKSIEAFLLESIKVCTVLVLGPFWYGHGIQGFSRKIPRSCRQRHGLRKLFNYCCKRGVSLKKSCPISITVSLSAEEWSYSRDASCQNRDESCRAVAGPCRTVPSLPNRSES